VIGWAGRKTGRKKITLVIGWVARKTGPKRLLPRMKNDRMAKGQAPKRANELQETPKRESSSGYCCDLAVPHAASVRSRLKADRVFLGTHGSGLNQSGGKKLPPDP
ncbi:hypothetical protein ACCT25_35805, partial [Rhizobium ruizarguesonis]